MADEQADQGRAIAGLLNQMTSVLRHCGHASAWRATLRALADDANAHPQRTRMRIVDLYGGADPIDAVQVYQADGEIDFDKTDEFAELTERLYILAAQPNAQTNDIATIKLSNPKERLRIIERTDGFFTIAAEYYYRSVHGGRVIAEGWATRETDGIFATFELAQREARVMARPR